MKSTFESYQCQVCDADALERLAAYSELPRVTSDCKPWPAGGTMTVCRACGMIQKVPDVVWLDEIKRIYNGYQIYSLSGGEEQVIFNAMGGAFPRSRLLVDFIEKSVALAPRGRLLDIGCGTGAALASFSSGLPEWSLYGSELSNSALPQLKKLANFVELFTVEPRDIRGTFDFISMIHSLEHMPHPVRTLREVRGILADGGTLFVEIPDAETSPFDLIVADHLGHFTRATLGYAAASAGFSITVLRNDILPKENSLIACRGEVRKTAQPDAASGLRLAKRNIAWLNAVIERAAVAASEDRIGVFGTSISGVWLCGALRERISFFVDEDPSRVGGSIEGRPILAPHNVPADTGVFVPLIPEIADKVVKRLSSTGVSFIAPPPLLDTDP